MKQAAIKQHSSHFPEKIKLREMALLETGKDRIQVLDCFHAEGRIWDTIKRRNPDIEITVIGIEKERTKKSQNFVFYGDNVKVIKSIDLSAYDLIDLDAYGCCWKQLDSVFKNGTASQGTPIIYTQIAIRQNGVYHDVYDLFGLRPIARACPSILHPVTNLRSHLHGALAARQVKTVKEYVFRENGTKIYGYFVLGQ